jgi:hypothetical protein
MTKDYQHTISGLLKKRSELMGDGQQLRARLAEVGNAIDSLDHVLRSLGFDGDLDGMKPRSNRVVYFHRNELRRFLIDELRNASEPVSARDLAEKIIGLEGKDSRDRTLRNDMVKRVGKSLKLLRQQGVAVSEGRNGDLAWRLADSPAADSLRRLWSSLLRDSAASGPSRLTQNFIDTGRVYIEPSGDPVLKLTFPGKQPDFHSVVESQPVTRLSALLRHHLLHDDAEQGLT